MKGSEKAFLSIYLQRHWLRGTLSFLLLGFIIAKMMNEVKVFCRTMEICVSPWSFALITCNPVPQSFFVLGGVLLFGDLINSYVEKKRSERICKQLFAKATCLLCAAIALYVMLLFLLTVAMATPKIEFTLSWGSALRTLAQADIQMNYLYIWNIPYKVIVNYTSLQATVIAYLLLCLAILALTGLMVLGRALLGNKAAISLLPIMIVCFDIHAINELSTRALYFSPVSLSRLFNLDKRGLHGLPSVQHAFFYLTGLCVVALGASYAVLTLRNKPERGARG